MGTSLALVMPWCLADYTRLRVRIFAKMGFGTASLALAQSHARPAAVLCNELDAGRFESMYFHNASYHLRDSCRDGWCWVNGNYRIGYFKFIQ